MHTPLWKLMNQNQEAQKTHSYAHADTCVRAQARPHLTIMRKRNGVTNLLNAVVPVNQNGASTATAK